MTTMASSSSRNSDPDRPPMVWDTRDLPHAPLCYAGQPMLQIEHKPGVHNVLFNTDEDYNWKPEGEYTPRPLSDAVTDDWNENHVKMPSSKKCKIILSQSGVVVEKWDIISEALGEDLTEFKDLKAAILSYNPDQKNSWNLQCLETFFEKNPLIANNFFLNVLPPLQLLALKLPALILQPIPFLKKNKNQQLTMSQEQAASLLANAFLCTFPDRGSFTDYLPSFNFNTLFNGRYCERQGEKLRCILHYFDRVAKSMPDGSVSFTRRCMASQVDMSDFSKCKFTRMCATPAGKIDATTEQGLLQVSFANRFVGGDLFLNICAQEQMLFSVCPEMIVSRLVTPVLSDLEVLVMTGCERYSSFRGYNETFAWVQNYVDVTENDTWGRKYTEVVAMDAKFFKNDKEQFSIENLKREFNKAFCGFRRQPEFSLTTVTPAVCTGNWGCGIAKGNKELKALIQLMAASYAKRDINYLTYDHHKLSEQLTKLHEYIYRENMTLKVVWNAIVKYWSSDSDTPPTKTLFEHLASKFDIENL